MPTEDENNKIATRSVESLNHFRCQDCDKWWSVGDAPEGKHEWYCPWCGIKQNFDNNK